MQAKVYPSLGFVEREAQSLAYGLGIFVFVGEGLSFAGL
ncbi:hypothetical protein PALB_24000 [Pseudoalteromonas luteoviolacea B = ATCC 29581]|nr:hypothetical protein PALB_24000 [Pseudoalteromonas luteoviolacea B = ATCC 29581]